MGLFGQGVLGNLISGVGTGVDFILPGSPAANLGGKISGGGTGSLSETVKAGGSPTSDPTFRGQGLNGGGGGWGDATSGGQPTGYSADSNPTDNSAYYGAGGSGSGGGSSYSQDDLDYLNYQEGILRGMLDRLGRTKADALTSVDSQYNTEVSKSNLNRGRAIEDFNLKTTDTERGKDTAINRVGDNSRMLRNSVLRRIAMAAGGDTSAKQVADSAVARDASIDRGNVLESFGVNFRNLDLAKKRAEEDYRLQQEDLATQRDQQRRNVELDAYNNEIGVNEKLMALAGDRAKLLGGGFGSQRLAMQPYQSAIDQKNAEIDGLFSKYSKPVLTPKAVNVQTPTLRDYIVDRTAVNAANQSGQEDYTPYSNFLKKDDQETA